MLHRFATIGALLVGLGSAGPLSVPAAAADLRLISLRCLSTEDNAGPDEAYIMADGRKVWGRQDINDGQTADLRQVAPIRFEQRVKLELWDYDWPDADDWLGDVIISVDQAGRGELTATFTEDGASYVLTYIVVP